MSTQVIRKPGARLNRQKPKKKNRRVLLGIVGMLILAVVILLLLKQCTGMSSVLIKDPPAPIVAGDLFPAQGAGVSNGALGGMTSEQIMEQMQKIADASQFSFKINSAPRFKDGKSEGDFWIENPKYNVYPMVVQIFLDDTQELVFDSGGILPNQNISFGKLLKELPKGNYQATAYLNAYDPDTKVFQGRSAAKLTLIIEN